MNDILDITQLYRDVEDHLVSHLRLTLGERAVYYHLLRHSRLEGQRLAQVSRRSLARGVGCTANTAQAYIQRLADKACIRILERSHAGHLLEVLTPEEITGSNASDGWDAENLDAADCFRNDRLRVALLRRERYSCFYCLRRLRPETTAFDHAIPAAAGGDNSFRNIVACCFDCNSHKMDRPADEYLRELYRAARLSAADLDRRLAALQALQAGRLLPQISSAA